MKSAIYNPELKESSCLETKEVDQPKLDKPGALVKVKAVGVCGSDLLKLDRNLVKPGTILGHEMVGEIIELQTTLKSNFKVGDRIVSSHHVPCLECDFCLRDKQSLCQKFKSTNFIPGAFCEYLVLSEDHLKHTVQKVPDHLTNLQASFTEPVACCIKAVNNSMPKTKAKLKHLVIGLGSIGLITGQLIKLYFPEDEVYGMDLNEDRLKLAESFGIYRHPEQTNRHPEQTNRHPEHSEGSQAHSRDSSPSAQNDDTQQAQNDDTQQAQNDNTQQAWNDELYDNIFLCAGANATVELASKLANNGAVITVFSSTPRETSFLNNDIYYKELTVKGSYSPNLSDLKEALDLISNSRIKVDDLISHEASLDDLGETIQKAKEELGIKVLLELK